MCRGPVGGNVLFKRLVRCGPAKLDKWFRKRKSTEARLAGKSCLKGPTTERPSSPQAPCVAGVSSRAFLRLGQCRPGSYPSGGPQLVRWTLSTVARCIRLNQHFSDEELLKMTRLLPQWPPTGKMDHALVSSGPTISRRKSTFQSSI